MPVQQTYASLLDSVKPLRLLHEPSSDSADAQLPSEIELQSLWFSGQFGRDFTSTCGKPIRITKMGSWNRSSGPDFLHAAIEIDGEQHSGPIEIDTRSRDWEGHGHHENHHFDETILHVVFRDSKVLHFTRTSQHREVIKVVIPQAIVQKAIVQPLSFSALEHLGRCYQPLAKMPQDRIVDLLEQAARHRCALKASKIKAINQAHGYDQALWVAITETLGYRPNKLMMGVLAQRLPIQQLREQNHISAIIFGTAGFLHPKIHQKSAPESQQWLEDLWKSWWKIRTHYELGEGREIDWVFHGIRPINHPHRRLASLCAIAKHWSLFKKHLENTSAFIAWLTSIREPHWERHYTLTSKITAKPLALIGKDRAHDFVINHLLPLHIAESPQKERAWKVYQQFPAPAINEKVKRAHYRLFGERRDAKQFLTKAWHHQALLQLYHDFCLKDTSECAKCPFPEQLMQF